MKIRKSGSLFAALLICLSAASQSASNTWSVKISDAIISRYQPNINAMTGKGWEYSNSIILHGMELVYGKVPTASYLSYIQAYVDAYVNSSGTISGLAQSLDRIHPGLLLLFLYQQTGATKYKTAATNLRNYLLNGSPAYPKNGEGGYWHKNSSSYTNVMMADGIYMAYPFLVKYGVQFNDPVAIDTAVDQTLLLASHLYQSSSHLMLHAWNYDKTTYAWSNPTTGNSSEVWSRGLGWYVMALVDMLEWLPASHPKRAQLMTLLQNLCVGIAANQDPTTGLWWQVVDKGGQSGNYLETSGSAMFVYSLKVASDSGWISSSYLTNAKNGWVGLKTKIGTYTDGLPMIMQFAPAMSVQNNYSAYVGIAPVNVPTASGTQHPHGYAAMLMAASVMEFPLATLPVSFSSFTASRQGSLVDLSWDIQQSRDLDHYELQRSTDGIHYSGIQEIVPQAGSHYQVQDQPPAGSAILYYRVRAVSLDGSSDYSKVGWVKMTAAPQAVMTISPVPVSGRQVEIRWNNLSAGNYRLQIIGAGGRIFWSGNLQLAEQSKQSITLPAEVRSGLYYFRLEGQGQRISQPVMVQ